MKGATGALYPSNVTCGARKERQDLPLRLSRQDCALDGHLAGWHEDLHGQRHNMHVYHSSSDGILSCNSPARRTTNILNAQKAVRRLSRPGSQALLDRWSRAHTLQETATQTMVSSLRQRQARCRIEPHELASLALGAPSGHRSGTGAAA
jgi:hypothetical protein